MEAPAHHQDIVVDHGRRQVLTGDRHTRQTGLPAVAGGVVAPYRGQILGDAAKNIEVIAVRHHDVGGPRRRHVGQGLPAVFGRIENRQLGGADRHVQPPVAAGQVDAAVQSGQSGVVDAARKGRQAFPAVRLRIVGFERRDDAAAHGKPASDVDAAVGHRRLDLGAWGRHAGAAAPEFGLATVLGLGPGKPVAAGKNRAEDDQD